jgi:hypothetical protein
MPMHGWGNEKHQKHLLLQDWTMNSQVLILNWCLVNSSQYLPFEEQSTSRYAQERREEERREEGGKIEEGGGNYSATGKASSLSRFPQAINREYVTSEVVCIRICL